MAEKLYILMLIDRETFYAQIHLMQCYLHHSLFLSLLEEETINCPPFYDMIPALIKNKIKFSAYIKKCRRDRFQSHIWLKASSYIVKYLRISSYIRKPILIYEFTTDTIWISVYMRKVPFSFLSVYSTNFKSKLYSTLSKGCQNQGRILGRNWNKSLKSFPLCYSQVTSTY